MSNKEEVIEIDGIVAEQLPNAMFRVKLDNGSLILAYSCGKIKKNKIRIFEDDKVKLEISPYDLTRGRIVYRYSSHNISGVNPIKTNKK